MPAAKCGTCSFLLRLESGVHHAGEPMTMTDEDGRFIRCPQCGAQNRQSDLAAPTDSDVARMLGNAAAQTH